MFGSVHVSYTFFANLAYFRLIVITRKLRKTRL
nr:MAG TPA: hypothetical protein [Caudoviricetes sp.]